MSTLLLFGATPPVALAVWAVSDPPIRDPAVELREGDPIATITRAITAVCGSRLAVVLLLHCEVTPLRSGLHSWLLWQACHVATLEQAVELLFHFLNGEQVKQKLSRK
jgi:hypothetical protein